MASFQILKSNLSPSLSQLDPGRHPFRFRAGSTPHLHRKQLLGYKDSKRKLNHYLVDRRLRIYCKFQENDKQKNGEEPPESLFMKELKRRGMNPTSLIEESNRTSYGDDDLKFREEDEIYFNKNVMFNQREQSMALNSEGLEGLIPRAKLLLSIGGTFFLAFGPLILLTVAFFFGLYLYFGSAFIHDASSAPTSPPQYIDPYALLEDQRISEMSRGLN